MARSVLVGRADGEADRLRRPEGPERPHDHALPQERVEEHAGVAARLRVDEVGHGRAGQLEAEPAEGALDVAAGLLVGAPPARDLLLVAEARQRGHLRGRREIERAPHLADRGHEVGRADAVADAQPREPVDLRERAQHDDALSPP